MRRAPSLETYTYRMCFKAHIRRAYLRQPYRNLIRVSYGTYACKASSPHTSCRIRNPYTGRVSREMIVKMQELMKLVCAPEISIHQTFRIDILAE